MGVAIWSLIQALFTNRSKDLFVARLGTRLLLAKYGVTGWVADLLSIPIRAVIGLLVDESIYVVDVTMDAIKAAMSMDEFKVVANQEYQRAKRKDLSDVEKDRIRKDYLDTLDRFTRLRG